MDKITISNSAKKIQVNENGEYIVVDVRDQAFVGGLLEIIQNFDEKKPEYLQRMSEIQAMPDGTKGELIKKGIAVCKVNAEICNELKEKVDAIFHDEVCRKLFGNITPSVTAFAEFFEQLAPIVKKAQAEHYDKIKKYTAKYNE